jgi:hypothetical protein
VQQRLLAATNDPAIKSRLQETLQSVSAVVAREVDRRAEVRQLPAHVVQMDKFKLKSELTGYVEAGKLTETVIVLSTLTELAGDTIRQLLSCEESDGLLIACKSCGLGWTTVRPLLELAGKARGASNLNVSSYLDQYTKISRESADRVMRFLKVRKSASINDMKEMLAS